MIKFWCWCEPGCGATITMPRTFINLIRYGILWYFLASVTHFSQLWRTSLSPSLGQSSIAPMLSVGVWMSNKKKTSQYSILFVRLHFCPSHNCANLVIINAIHTYRDDKVSREKQMKLIELIRRALTAAATVLLAAASWAALSTILLHPQHRLLAAAAAHDDWKLSRQITWHATSCDCRRRFQAAATLINLTLNYCSCFRSCCGWLNGI